jgi:hypothetical protein
MAVFQSGGIKEQVNVTATTGGTTTLVGNTTVFTGSTLGKQIQVFTGTLGQTVILPNATNMAVGQKFEIINQSTGLLTLQFNGGTAFTDASGTNYSNINHNTSIFVILQTNGTTAGTWAVLSSTTGAIGSPGPTIQKFTSGSGTYTTPANVAYIKVRMVGGGGGGGGGGTTNGTAATAGTASTFGTSLLSAGGGGLGVAGQTNGAPGAGGTSSLGTGPIGTALTGTPGMGGGTYNTGTGQFSGVSGGSGYFGGGGSGNYQSAGSAATANSGSGGGSGGATDNASASQVGGSGGSGGYVEAIIVGPAATYTYTVGSGGNAGGAGANGFAGGAGAAGYIEVTEYYFNGMGALAGNGGAYQPTVQTFTSGSGTFTTPTNASYIKVRMVGGGGGGSGSGTASVTNINGNSATASTSSTFGTLTANGGSGGVWSSGSGLQGGGVGGTASLGSGPIGTALTGAQGQGAATTNTTNTDLNGGAGGNSFFGGSGNSSWNQTGTAGISNTGGGGGGGGGSTSAATQWYAGGGGGSGGYVEAIISNPTATYSYAVGTGGSGGTAGTNGLAGGAGAAGYIEVTIYYNNGAVGTATNVTGVVAVANGGTGDSSLTPYAVMTGGTTSTGAMQQVSGVGTTGQILTSNGASALPTWAAPVSSYNYTAKTGTYSAVANDLVDCTSGTFTVTLPTAASISGQRIMVKNSGTGVITINTTSAQTIDGLASGKILLATQTDSLVVISDGSNWKVEVLDVNVSFFVTFTSAQNSGNGSNAQVSWGVVGSDTQNGFASNQYTIVIPGDYTFSTSVRMNNVAGTNPLSLYIYKNGSQLYVLDETYGIANGQNPRLKGTITLNGLAVGDTIRIYSQNNAQASALETTAGYNYFSGVRNKGA